MGPNQTLEKDDETVLAWIPFLALMNSSGNCLCVAPPTFKGGETVRKVAKAWWVSGKERKPAAELSWNGSQLGLLQKPKVKVTLPLYLMTLGGGGRTAQNGVVLNIEKISLSQGMPLTTFTPGLV